MHTKQSASMLSCCKIPKLQLLAITPLGSLKPGQCLQSHLHPPGCSLAVVMQLGCGAPA